jgi:hypothetical protein
MLPSALEAGITAYNYWDMTYGEIVDTITAHNKRKKSQMQQDASLYYSLANLIGLSVGRLLDEKIKMPEITDAFPTLFDDIIPKKPVQTDWRIIKERMTDFANNKKSKQGN